MSSSQHERPSLGALRGAGAAVETAPRRSVPSWALFVGAGVSLVIAVVWGVNAVASLPRQAPADSTHRSTVSVQGTPYPGLTQERVDAAMQTALPHERPAHYTIRAGSCAGMTAPPAPNYLVCVGTDARGVVSVDLAGEDTESMRPALLKDNLEAGWLGSAVRAFTDAAFPDEASRRFFPWVSTIAALVFAAFAATLLLAGLGARREERAWAAAWVGARRRLAAVVTELDAASSLAASRPAWGAGAPDPDAIEALRRAEAARAHAAREAAGLLAALPEEAPTGRDGRESTLLVARTADDIKVQADAALLALSVATGGVVASHALASLARPVLRASQDLVFTAAPGSNVARRAAEIEEEASELLRRAPLLAQPGPNATNPAGSAPTLAQARAAWASLTRAVEAPTLTLPAARYPGGLGLSSRAATAALDLLNWPSGTVALLRERLEEDTLTRLRWDPLSGPVFPKGRRPWERSSAAGLPGEITGGMLLQDAVGVVVFGTLLVALVAPIGAGAVIESGRSFKPAGQAQVGTVQAIGDPSVEPEQVQHFMDRVPLPRPLDLVFVRKEPAGTPGRDWPTTAAQGLRATHPEFFDATSGEPLPGRAVVLYGERPTTDQQLSLPDDLVVWGVLTPEPATVSAAEDSVQDPPLSTSFTPREGWESAVRFDGGNYSLAKAAIEVTTYLSIGQQVEDKGDPTARDGYVWMTALAGGWVAVVGLGLVAAVWLRRRSSSGEQRVEDLRARVNLPAASERLDALLVGWDLTELDAIAAGERSLVSVDLAEAELAVAAAWRDELESVPRHARRGVWFQRDVEAFSAQVARLESVRAGAAAESDEALGHG